MSPYLISFFAAAGAAGWIYSKTMVRTGNNTRSSITTMIVVGIITFVVVFTALGFVDSSLTN